MLLEIHGHHFPGRFWHVDAEPCDNLHVGLQVRRDPTDLVRGDTETAVWSTDIEVVERPEGLDFCGPAVQGRPGSRFVYLTWGNVGPDDSFTMVRRAKLMLDDLIDITALTDPGLRVVAHVDLTDECGGPRCARLRPPAVQVSAGQVS